MAALRRVLLLLTSTANVAAAVGLIRLRSANRSTLDAGADGSFVRRVEFEHRLRVCNAYPLKGAVDVFVDTFGASQRLTEDGPLPYKACSDFKTKLNTGDKLDFKVGDSTTGTFSISSLPSSDAILLLVIHRHDELSTAAAFESNVYGNLPSAQVAVIDTFKGKATTTPRIKEKYQVVGKGSVRSEDLRYSSVVAVNQGAYTVELDDGNGTKKATGDLVALNRECYVVMRTGVDTATGQFPEELVVFPQSSPHLLHSGAFVAGTASASLLAALITCLSLL